MFLLVFAAMVESNLDLSAAILERPSVSKNLRYGLVDLPILVTADSNTAVDNLVKAITNLLRGCFRRNTFYFASCMKLNR